MLRSIGKQSGESADQSGKFSDERIKTTTEIVIKTQVGWNKKIIYNKPNISIEDTICSAETY